MTNALLLFSMKDSFFEALREFDIELNISFYPPLEARKEDLLALLRKKEVRYVVTPLIREFTKKQTLHRHENGRGVTSYHTTGTQPFL